MKHQNINRNWILNHFYEPKEVKRVLDTYSYRLIHTNWGTLIYVAGIDIEENEIKIKPQEAKTQ